MFFPVHHCLTKVRNALKARHLMKDVRESLPLTPCNATSSFSSSRKKMPYAVHFKNCLSKNQTRARHFRDCVPKFLQWPSYKIYRNVLIPSKLAGLGYWLFTILCIISGKRAYFGWPSRDNWVLCQQGSIITGMHNGPSPFKAQQTMIFLVSKLRLVRGSNIWMVLYTPFSKPKCKHVSFTRDRETISSMPILHL